MNTAGLPSINSSNISCGTHQHHSEKRETSTADVRVLGPVQTTPQETSDVIYSECVFVGWSSNIWRQRKQLYAGLHPPKGWYHLVMVKNHFQC